MNAKPNLPNKTTRATVTTLALKNAGVVLLNNYIPILFNRLGLTNENQFIDNQAAGKAVQYLQFLITGQSATEDICLPLNKVLCGLPLAQSVPQEIDISNNEQQLIEGLINAVINYWKDIGTSSVSGFRGNWLIREGLLTETEERWELTVEKRPYDLLISRSSFSFSIIKHPWMPKPLHVNWPY
ncbi:hypothetical protein D0C36_18545 [Mucilaginibacter conchicola]|uniref:Uncharacterized protein n=1 Tax=Mucilaginibacter conchicola TaxID=2303333 RepID=A0A372NPT1_9SPHI|nr:contractile injection system tape measure protein [Mucilaginibacter conchicola]RFZ90946.1 hypothetical protein D0C36_18545 [Mucilaginibacter conchicola]